MKDEHKKNNEVNNKTNEKKDNLKSIKVPINNHYFDDNIFDTSDNCNDDNCNEKESAIQKKLEKLYRGCSGLNESDLKDFSNIKIFHFRKDIKNIDEKNGLIYEVKEKKSNDTTYYYVKTGNYIGTLYFRDGKSLYTLEINSGYDKSFENHMINYASNIFFKDEFKGGSTKSNNKIMFLYRLFLLRLKKVLALGNPLLMRKVEKKSLNIKGRINLRKYLKDEFYYNYKITTILNSIVPEQEIVDIIYKTLYMVHKELKDGLSVDYVRYEKELKMIYSYRPINSITFNKAYNSKLLRNAMYSGYNGVLQISELILRHKNILNDSSNIGVSGYLMDVSELWEIYLQRIMERDLSKVDYTVNPQNAIKIYKERFYSRGNYPDIVLESKNGDVAVIDAKFKNMRFIGKDVDRDDLHQIHSYAFYYYTRLKDKLKFCSLLYPVKSEVQEKNNSINKIFGDSNDNNIETKFKILTLKIPSGNLEDDTKIRENERLLTDEIYKMFKN